MGDTCRGQCAYGDCPFPRCIRTGERRIAAKSAQTDPAQTVFELGPAVHLPAQSAGFAVDIGTTAVKAALCSCDTGEILASATRPNPQRALASDVISRIELAAANETAETQLTADIRTCIREMCADLCSLMLLTPEQLAACVVTGNTTMLHLFTGLSPAAMGIYPYRPASLFGEEYPPDTLGMQMECAVYLPPCISAFVGADITCGLLSLYSGAEWQPGLLLDLGTNGEMVLDTGGHILCAAAAAGPVFEGGGISCGMPPVAGAINRVWESDGSVCFSVIGDLPPAGVCASGLLDAIYVFLRQGTIGESGQLETGNDRGDDPALIIAPEVSLSQKDVRAFQLAKAAIRAGIDVLGNEGHPKDTAPEIWLAGGIGAYISVAAAKGTGLVPSAWPVRAAGNTALSGAVAMLTDAAARGRAAELAARCEMVDLAANSSFTERFTEALLF